MTYEEIDKAISKSELSPIEWLAENHSKLFYVNNNVKNLDRLTYGIVKGIVDIACDVADIDGIPSYMQDYFDISLDKMEFAVSDSIVDYAKTISNLIMQNIDLKDKESLVYYGRDVYFGIHCGDLTDKEAKILKDIKPLLPFIELNTENKFEIFY